MPRARPTARRKMAVARAPARKRPIGPVRRPPGSTEERADLLVAPIVPGSVPPGSETLAVPRVERPSSQAVCRGCGRIVELGLTLDELRSLANFAGRAPDGWRIDGLSFTLMGACRACREVRRRPS